MRVFFVDFENKCQYFVKEGARKIEEQYGSYPPIEVHIYHSYGQRSPQVPESLYGKDWITVHYVPRGRNAVDKQLIEDVRAYYRKDDAGDDIFVVSGGDKIYQQLRPIVAEVIELKEGDRSTLADYTKAYYAPQIAVNHNVVAEEETSTSWWGVAAAVGLVGLGAAAYMFNNTDEDKKRQNRE